MTVRRNEIEAAFGPDATRQALGLTWEEFATGLWSEVTHLRAAIAAAYQRGYDTAGADFDAHFDHAERDDQCLHGDTFFTRATTAGDRCPWCVIDELSNLVGVASPTPDEAPK